MPGPESLGDLFGFNQLSSNASHPLSKEMPWSQKTRYIAQRVTVTPGPISLHPCPHATLWNKNRQWRSSKVSCLSRPSPRFSLSLNLKSPGNGTWLDISYDLYCLPVVKAYID